MMFCLDKNISVDMHLLGDALVCALRYCQGRRTYMPSAIIDFTIPLLNKLEDTTLSTMLRDCDEQARYGNYGDDIIDKPKWLSFKDAVEHEIARRKKIRKEEI